MSEYRQSTIDEDAGPRRQQSEACMEVCASVVDAWPEIAPNTISSRRGMGTDHVRRSSDLGEEIAATAATIVLIHSTMITRYVHAVIAQTRAPNIRKAHRDEGDLEFGYHTTF